MHFIRKILRRPAIFVVTVYARHIYNEGVRAAEQRRARERRTIYLAAQTFRPDRLKTYDKAQFKAEKRVFGVSARLLTMNTLRRGCYYHTADAFGSGALSDREKETRRKAFVRERLRLAKLI